MPATIRTPGPVERHSTGIEADRLLRPLLPTMEDHLPADGGGDGDGWQLAVRQAGECITGTCREVAAVGGFTADARALGAVVAQVHAALAQAFPRITLKSRQIRDRTAEMNRRLRAAVRLAPALEPYADRVARLYDDYAKVALRGRGEPGQRIHGDLHLGQVLRTADGWKVIDFEGDPSRPIAERSLPQPVVKDVASMLRSFDHAAQQALGQVLAGPGPVAETAAEAADRAPARLRQTRRAYAWAVRSRRAFTAGYAAAGGVDPHCHPVALRAFEADKAVDEVAYEAQHRPDWLPIPLAAIQRLVFGR